ncbi:dATP/dGTP diphosphohydrolase domain-containing protein [Nitrosopumilus sp.]|uniref:dATP/dGTP diphosphohydrolase domain-containing protein n=1 Tax=Nitrosopumilus sp. TaxID=2024843 RepID=UPI003D118334
MTDANPKFKGSKHNAQKIMMELVPMSWMKDVAAVMTYGANKYAPGNWKQGLPEEEVIGAMLRHIEQFRSGEQYDKETGLDHRAHAACELMFWMELYPVKNKSKTFETMWKKISELPKKKKGAKKKK